MANELEVVDMSTVKLITDPSGATFIGYASVSGKLETVRISFEDMKSIFGLTDQTGNDATKVINQKALTQLLEEKADITNAQGTLVRTPDGTIPEVDTSGLAPKENEEGLKVVYSKDGKIEIPENVLQAATVFSFGKHLHSGKGHYLDLNSGEQAIDPANNTERQYVYMYPVEIGVYTLEADFLNAGHNTMKVFFIYNESGAVIQKLTNTAIVDNKVTFNITEKGFISFYLFHDHTTSTDYYYSILDSYVFTDPNAGSEIAHAVLFPDNKIIDISNVDKSLYVSDKKNKINTDNYLRKSTNFEYLSLTNGKIETQATQVDRGWVYLLPLKAGNYVLEADYFNNTANLEFRRVLIYDKPGNFLRFIPYTEVQENKRVNFVLEQDGYISFYTYLKDTGYTYELKTISLSGSSSMAISFPDGSTKEFVEQIEDIQKQIALTHFDNYSVNGLTGTLVAYGTDGLFKCAINEDDLLEPETDYIIDFGKNNELQGGRSFVWLYEQRPQPNVGGKIFFIGSYNRYAEFSTKGLPNIKYVAFTSKAYNPTYNQDYDVSRKAKIYKKTANWKMNILGSSFSSKDIKTDYSDERFIRLPKPEWIKINVLGYNSLITLESGRVNMEFEYLDSNGAYFKKNGGFAIQGNTTAFLPKKNYKVKMTNADGSNFYLQLGDDYPRGSYHLKANAHDVTQARNIGIYRLYDRMLKNRSYVKRYPNSKSFDIAVSDIRQRFNHFEPKFVAGGTPCTLYFANGFVGNYTWNINVFCENYDVYESDKNAFVYRVRTAFDTPDFSNKTLPDELEEVKTDTYYAINGLNDGEDEMNNDTKQPMFDLAAWVYSVRSNMPKYKAEMPEHFDMEFMYMYYLLCWFTDNWDSWINNFVFLTYDRNKFYVLPYDCDQSFGFQNSPNGFRQPNANTHNNEPSKLFDPFYAQFSTEINAMYKELRDNGIFSVETIEEIFTDIMNKFSYDNFRMDILGWGTYFTNAANTYSSLGQVLDWTQKRIAFLDQKFGYNR